ncbi:tetraspanin-18B-like [Styela clava]
MAMKSASLSCLKYLMFFFNLLFFICGAGILGVGVWALIHEGSFEPILGRITIYEFYVIIGVGAALFFLGFLGCCGAIKKNRCLLGTFFVLVLIILIVEVAGAILVYVERDNIERYALKSMEEYDTGGETDRVRSVTRSWDMLQETMECCGYNSYKDWGRHGTFTGNVTIPVPDSCCKSNPSYSNSACEGDDLHEQGCAGTLLQGKMIVGAVALGVILVEILAMVFACCLYRFLANYKSVP